MGKLEPEERDTLRAAMKCYGPGLDDAEKLYTIATRQTTWLQLKIFQIGHLQRGLRGGRRLWTLLVLLLVAGLAVGVTALGAVLVPAVVRWAGGLAGALWTGGLVGLVVLSREQLRQVREEVSTAVARVRRAGEAQQRQIQAELDAADTEVETLQRELQNLTAAGQLAALVAERATGGGYRRNLGLMTQIREDFQRMADLLTRDHVRARVPAGDDTDEVEAKDAGMPQIDRIVLYVDDLDRCPPARVVATLEAIHLLLAVPLFVVVVAVDPRWLRRAISAHYRDLLESDHPSGTSEIGEDARFDGPAAGSPAQYLEKIFQVVMTLPPLRTAGYTSLLDTLVGVRADEMPNATEAMTEQPDVIVVDPTGPEAVRAGNSTEPDAVGARFGDGPLSSSEPVQLTAPRRTERVDPLALSAEERRLLELLGPPLITTPRSVKRLANSYGLFTALRRLRGQPAIEDEDRGATRAAMVLLAGLIGFPARGPRLLTELHGTADRALGWRGFLDEQATDSEPAANGGQRSDNVPRGRSGRPGDTCAEREWIALIRALSLTTDRALAAGLPLPENLRLWRQWIGDVGRLSFPAGPVAAAFETQEHAEEATSKP